jgi:hypothetical protein
MRGYPVFRVLTEGEEKKWLLQLLIGELVCKGVLTNMTYN